MAALISEGDLSIMGQGGDAVDTVRLHEFPGTGNLILPGELHHQVQRATGQGSGFHIADFAVGFENLHDLLLAFIIGCDICSPKEY